MDRPEGTVTFLFTDVEGSTRLWQRDPAGMRAAVARHDVLLRQVIADHDGAVFSTMGDGLAAAFRSATPAVRAAVEAQCRIGAEPWPTPAPLRVRMGLHTGEAELRDGDYFGIAVNRAARLTAVGHGGQVLCSSVTAALVDTEVTLTDLGEHHLRDLGQPLRLFQVGGGTFGPLRSSAQRLGNLPIPTSSLVGRQRELAVLADAIGSTRLVTVVGVGGVGKTRLAIEAGSRACERYADGVWLTELAPIVSEEGLDGGVMRALGTAAMPGQTARESLLGYLAPKQALVVLDNCEHLLWPIADLVEEWLQHCAELTVLATSREPLGVSGERVLHLPSLRPPKGGGLDEVRDSPAAQLFCERAEQAGAPVALDDANAATVAAICRRLDGIPLALELAAARARSMPLPELEDRLQQTFRLLVGSGRGAVERHQTLRRTVEWSYGLLKPGERAVFQRISVFPGGFTLEAAEAVAARPTGEHTMERFEVADALGALVDKSLVSLDHDRRRYRLLETLRLFAAEHLAGTSEADDVRRAHAGWCVEFFAECSRHLTLPDAVAWLRRVVSESDNLRAAAQWAMAAGDMDVIADLLFAMQLDRSRTHDETHHALTRAVADAPSRIDPDRRRAALAAAAYDLPAIDLDRARALAREIVAADPDTRDVAAGQAHAALCLCALLAGQPDEVETHLKEAHDICRALTKDGTANWLTVLFGIGFTGLLAISGRVDPARRMAEAAVAFADATESPLARRDARLELGIVLAEAGDYARALPLLEAGTLGAPDVPAFSHHWNAMARARAQVEGPARFAGYRAAIVRHHTSGDEQFGLVNCLRYLSTDMELRGDPAIAAQLDGWSAAHTLLIAARHRQQREETVGRLTARLGPDQLTRLQEAGRRLAPDEVVRLALAAIDRQDV